MVACIVALGILASCGIGGDAERGAAWNAGADTVRLANNANERIRTLLAQDDMDKSQRAMLERALANDGMISQSDYLTAWGNYKQCMVGKGYTAPPLRSINNVYIRQQKIDGHSMSEEQNSKFGEDNADCLQRYSLAVDEIYRENVANPRLYRDPQVAVVDCLHRNNLVAKDYTVRRYKEEWDSFLNVDRADVRTDRELYVKGYTQFSFDFGDSQVRTCVVANDSNLFVGELEAWKPLG